MGPLPSMVEAPGAPVAVVNGPELMVSFPAVVGVDNVVTLDIVEVPG